MAIRSPFIGQDGWYETDDRVNLLPNGTFRLIGRADRVVKVSEKRISLVEVEYCLQKLVEINEVVVVPLQTSVRLELGAVVQLTEDGLSLLKQLGRQTFTNTLRRALVDYIEPVGVPRRFRFVDEIPVNSQGKYEVSVLEGLFV